MDLSPVPRRSACDEVFDQLTGNIMRGSVGVGESLLSERRLAEVLGVSRPVVREALQRLAHAGLVEVRQGGATTVRDFRRHAGLNVLAQLLLPDGRLDLSVARSVLEARLLIGPSVAELAARLGRGDRLHEVVGQLADEAEPIRRQRLTLEFWDLLVDGADSIVFRLMFNSLRAAYEPLLAALAPMLPVDVAAYRAVADAVAGSDPDAARVAAHELLLPSTMALREAADRMEER